MSTFLIKGEQTHPGLDSFADAVAAAYAEHTRPQCLCSPSRPAMCIARLGPRYILRRMPGSGQQHDHRCHSWTVYSEMPARRRPSHRPTGRFSATGPVSPGVVPTRSVPVASRSRLAPPWSTQEKLVHLWMRASLTSWHPLTDEHRSWQTVRSRLLAAAASLRHHQHPLVDRLYIPEPFDLGQVSDIYARRRARWREIRHACSRLGGPAFVIAEVKACTLTKNGQRIVLRHIPDKLLEAGTPGEQAPPALLATGRWQHQRQAHVIAMIAVDLGGSSWHWRPDSGVLYVDSLWRPLETPDAGDTRSPTGTPGSTMEHFGEAVIQVSHARR